MDYKWLLLALEGRLNRKVLWLNFVVPYIVIAIVLVIIDGIVGTLGVLSTVFYIIMIWPHIAVGVKRCHDRGRTGWFLLIFFVPLLQLWPLVELYFLKGTTGSNKYGEDPLGGQADSPAMAGEAEETVGSGGAEDQGESSGSQVGSQ